jgi:hypothetical protein
MKQECKDWIDLDIDQIEPKPLSTAQKMNIKRHVLFKSKVKKPFNVRYLAIAALLCISVVTTSFMTIPALANQLPFIQKILTYFDGDALPNSYVDFATIVNQVQSDNGIDIMIENAVYDGTNVILTYAVQTEFEIGDNPRTEGFLEVKETSGIGGTGTIEKINDTTYVGVEKVTPHFKGESPEEIVVKWQPIAFENTQTNQQFEGDWTFEFTLAQLPTNVQLLNQTMKQDGLTLVMKSLEQSEMTAVLTYDYYVEKSILQKWQFVSIEMMEVKDNLGNVYKTNGNGGVSRENGASNEMRATIYSLNPDATSLTLTPEVYYSKGSGEVLEVKEMEPITILLDDQNGRDELMPFFRDLP